MKIASAPFIPWASSLVKASRPAATLRATSWSSPGSKIGITPCSSAPIFASSLSTQTTSWPKSEKQAPETRPT
jgi:hypothetical protein